MLWKLMNDQPVDILDNITRPYIIRSDLPVSKVFEGMSGRHTHMAIVADKMGKPLNELRFISIKEVK